MVVVKTCASCGSCCCLPSQDSFVALRHIQDDQLETYFVARVTQVGVQTNRCTITLFMLLRYAC